MMSFSRPDGRRSRIAASCLALLLPALWSSAAAGAELRHQVVPILGVTLDKEPAGTVAVLLLSFEKRADTGGLVLRFMTSPGRFSRIAQVSVEQAIYRTARAIGLSPDSWTVELSVPDPGITVYGDSLSAMVGLSVAALANGDSIASDRVITGTVTSDGRIGPVSSVPLKIAAAHEAHMRRVLIPEQIDARDGDWVTPFLVQVSPMGSVSQAYQALTE